MALDLAVQVSVASVANLGTITGSVSYDAPSISSRAPSNVAFRGGNVVALAVVNAGAADYTIQARIGMSACSTTGWVSDSSLVCRPSTCTGSDSIAVAVTAAVQVVTASMALTFDTPMLSSSRMHNAATVSAMHITLFGGGFGLQGRSPAASAGGSACEVTDWISDSSARAQVAAAVASERDLSVTVSKQAGSFTQAFTFDDPIITHVAIPNLPTSGAATSTLLGTDFGTSNWSPRAYISSSQCLSSLWTSDTSIVCVSVRGIGKAKTATVVIEGSNHSACITCGRITEVFSYNFPSVSSL
ncbi:MAG: IPT/TIG domain-containing protein, partial [Promethearchaeia archaeon]